MEAQAFKLGHAARILGINRRRLTSMSEYETITPSVADTTGQGVHRRYSFDDLVEAGVAIQFRSAGLTLKGIRSVMEGVRRKGRWEMVLHSDGGPWVVVHTARGCFLREAHEFTRREVFGPFMRRHTAAHSGSRGQRHED